MFPGLQATSASDITDGLSQTIGFSERSLGSGPDRRFDPWRDYWYSGLTLVTLPKDGEEMRSTCSSLASAPSSYWTQAGRTWIAGGKSDTLYNHVAPPNSVAPDRSAELPLPIPGDLSGGMITARSRHPQGVNVMMMDGSVHFVRSAIAIGAWRSLSTRSGGEPIGSEPY